MCACVYAGIYLSGSHMLPIHAHPSWRSHEPPHPKLRSHGHPLMEPITGWGVRWPVETRIWTLKLPQARGKMEGGIEI